MAILLNRVDSESVLIISMRADHIHDRTSISYPPMTQRLAHVIDEESNTSLNVSHRHHTET